MYPSRVAVWPRRSHPALEPLVLGVLIVRFVPSITPTTKLVRQKGVWAQITVRLKAIVIANFTKRRTQSDTLEPIESAELYRKWSHQDRPNFHRDEIKEGVPGAEIINHSRCRLVSHSSSLKWISATEAEKTNQFRMSWSFQRMTLLSDSSRRLGPNVQATTYIGRRRVARQVTIIDCAWSLLTPVLIFQVVQISRHLPRIGGGPGLVHGKVVICQASLEGLHLL